MSIISLKNISFAFGENLAIDKVSFEIKKGDYIGLVGPNGAGKSTLLKIILGVLKPQSGEIKTKKALNFGYVAQNYLLDSRFSVSVKEILEMGLKPKSFLSGKSCMELFVEKLKVVGLDESFLNKSFHNLSGGQKQRVIIARALLDSPEVLLFDEPLSGVDAKTKLKIYDLLADINEKFETTIIFVSHEIEHVIKRCKTILCLDKNLHEGCHPLNFIHQSEEIPQECSLDKPLSETKPIHHHHDN